MSGGWSTIESDPGLFTRLIETMGTPHVQVEELYALDPATLHSYPRVYGFVFLFKWSPTAQKARTGTVVAEAPVYYAKQVISNACATQAITAILFNAEEGTLDIGDTLSNLRAFTLEFPPDMRGLALSNSDEVRTAHNAFSRPEPFVAGPSVAAKEGDDVFHFVSFVCRAGRLWELDGLADGPLDHGPCLQEEFCDKIGPVIEQRISTYASAEIKFNLMVLCKDKRLVLREQLATASEDEKAMLEMALANEEAKREEWRRENVRRQHNFIPFVLELCSILAKAGKLEGMLEAAKETAIKAAQEAAKEGAKK